MSKVIVKIKLDEKIIFSKPLSLTDTLSLIREKIKERVNLNFVFLNNNKDIINKFEENNFCLKDIINQYYINGKIIQLKSEEREIEIYLNNKYIYSINLYYLEEEKNIEELRERLTSKIKMYFFKIKIEMLLK